MLHDSADVLHKGSSGPSVIEEVSLIREATKGHACGYLKIMKESINSALHASVIIKRVVVQVAELKCVSL